MNKTLKMLLIVVLVIIAIWLAFNQLPNYLDRDILNGKAAVLRAIPNAESVEFKDLRKVKYEGLTIVCGQFDVKGQTGEYVGYKKFSAKVVDKNAVFNEDQEQYELYCADTE
ncbi:hypothetical protein LG201_04265 [Methylobacillus gramineus]|uniref:hypothetical protein n=1 Tax=Methylobacillus gramineus TaxID=755169 RepID=UPI001CFFC697|nr:hypothetical protein [Methylobacillus gramineus]MCB5184414.1 hypothetical protein [Methylobacillus gramineus]